CLSSSFILPLLLPLLRDFFPWLVETVHDLPEHSCSCVLGSSYEDGEIIPCKEYEQILKDGKTFELAEIVDTSTISAATLAGPFLTTIRTSYYPTTD
ncbi:hypothetical protein BZA77DRAFT_389360, partial [Pyronema omphalodes]